MTLREKIKELCKRNNISVNKMETDLDFGKGYISKLDKSTPNSEKLKKIAEYLGVSLDYLMSDDIENGENGYYINKETADMAQKLFDNKDLRLLFDAAQDASPEDLKTTYDMLMALKRKERGED